MANSNLNLDEGANALAYPAGDKLPSLATAYDRWVDAERSFGKRCWV